MIASMRLGGVNRRRLVRRIFALLLLLCCSRADSAVGQEGNRLVIPTSPDTSWWVGIVNQGHLMPVQPGYEADLLGNLYGNQAQPLLLSDQGHVVWSEEPLRIQYEGASIVVESVGGTIAFDRPGTTLREAFLAASNRYFPPEGGLPDTLLFTAPQYNTWIELMYDQNQIDILEYARAIIDNGYPPGVLMIDDNWQEDYGKWDFHPGRFADPKAMVDSLHAMGFKVMMWVCPWVSPDSDVYRMLSARGAFLRDETGQPAMVRWWNGASALLDFTNPVAVEWFQGQLDYLVETYGVDGFKLDGGDAEYYMDVVAHEPVSPNTHAELYGKVGLKYPLNEYRAMWKMGGQPLAERLRDKAHNWDDLRKLVPHIVLQGLSGYAFSCPDMIGGGEYGSFLSAETMDQELVVRSAQASALMPMMQFSVAPWRILDEAHHAAVKASVAVRERFTDRILELAIEAAETGEPIVRPMEYHYPRAGYAEVKDQFMLGEDVLIAPVLQKGVNTKSVRIPPGRWRAWDGSVVKGPKVVEAEVGLSTIPYFERMR